MKISVFVAQQSANALGELAKLSLPAVTAFKVARLLKALQEPLAAYEEARMKLLKECGKPREEGAQEYEITDHQRWTTELGALLEHEIDLTAEKLTVDQLGNVAIEPRVLMTLDWLIDL